MWPFEEKSDPELRTLLLENVERIRCGDAEARRLAIAQVYELSYANQGRISYAIPALIECLSDPDEAISESLCYALSYAAPDSLLPLVDALQNPLPVARERAAKSLGQVGEAAQLAAAQLRHSLRDPIAAVRQRSAWALGLTRDSSADSVEELVSLAHSGDVTDRSSALHALGNIGKELDDTTGFSYCEKVVIDGLRDADDDVRWSALYAHESLPQSREQYVENIRLILQSDSSERVLQSALGYLKKIAPQTDLSALVATVSENLFRSRWLRSAACELMGAMLPAPRIALAELTRALDYADTELNVCETIWRITRELDARMIEIIRRSFHDSGESVCDFICEIGPPAAVFLPELLSALATEDYWDLQWAAADALGAVASSDPVVIAQLVNALGHDSPIVRSSAARALARVGEPAIPALCEVLRNRSDDRRAWAAFAFEKMGARAASAAPLLRECIRDEDQATVECCAIALAVCASDIDALPHLLRAVRNAEEQARRIAAIRAIGTLGPRAVSAADILNESTKSTEVEEVAAAEEALRLVSGLTN